MEREIDTRGRIHNGLLGLDNALFVLPRFGSRVGQNEKLNKGAKKHDKRYRDMKPENT